MTEAQLLQRARDGDPEAIRALYDGHASRVYAAARRIVVDEEAALDCAQESWVRAIRALPSFRGDARFSTWLHRIVVNTALEMVRKDGGETATLKEWKPTSSTDIAGDALLERRLKEALRRLPERMRAVLVLHDVEGYTHEEIGALLRCTAGTSKSQLFKARSKMREMLAGVRTAGRQEKAKA